MNNPFFYDENPAPNLETVEVEIVDDAQRRQTIEKLVRDYVLWSMGAGLLPIPMLDVAAVTALQMDMIKRIAEIYRRPVEPTQAKAWVGALAGSSGARLAADALKLIPVVGTVVGGVAQSVLSGGATYALAQVFVKHFESGGTYLDFDPNAFKDYFKQNLDKGLRYAEQLKKNYAKRFQKKRASAKHPGDTETLASQLSELKRLYDIGAINEEEFTRLKRKILEDL
ncbi:MAG: DUF697 domain-containing protein [Bacteroidia bacterium]|nr:DUF697 domain-containing protein [Bacteroidia bacterium]MDW8333333.1 DUF697 domain-containing protein [Bacteroidia bacterium]